MFFKKTTHTLRRQKQQPNAFEKAYVRILENMLGKVFLQKISRQ